MLVELHHQVVRVGVLVELHHQVVRVRVGQNYAKTECKRSVRYLIIPKWSSHLILDGWHAGPGPCGITCRPNNQLSTTGSFI